MTINESSALLLGHFIKNDSITNLQFYTITPKKVSAIEAEAAFVYSLLEMEKRELVVKYNYIDADGKSILVWILKQPLVFTKQSVEIDGNISVGIAKVVNDFFKQAGDKLNICNPLAIKQDDIGMLLEVINILAEQNLRKEEEIK